MMPDAAATPAPAAPPPAPQPAAPTPNPPAPAPDKPTGLLDVAANGAPPPSPPAPAPAPLRTTTRRPSSECTDSDRPTTSYGTDTSTSHGAYSRGQNLIC